MKDNIAVGTAAGLISGSIGAAYSYALFLLGLTPMSSIHLAASLVVIDIINLSVLGFINAVVTHLVVASVFSIMLTYLLLLTGKDFWVLKGIGFGVVFCLVAHSYLIPLVRTDAQVRSLIYNAASWTAVLSTHALIGLLSAIAIVKLHEKLKN